MILIYNGDIMRVLNPKDYDLEKALERKKMKHKKYGFRGDRLDVAMSKAEKSDIICPITGSQDLLDTAENINVCDKCFRSFKSYINVNAQPKMIMGIGKKERCAFCGKDLYIDTLKGIHSWWIIQMPVSLKAMWHKLGHKKQSLKIDGDRLFY
jgi:ribosomal protein L37AE/L43A